MNVPTMGTNVIDNYDTVTTSANSSQLDESVDLSNGLGFSFPARVQTSQNMSISSGNKPVKLIVGGTVFITSISTLVNSSQYFKAMFSGNFGDTNVGNESSVSYSQDSSYHTLFIDRDPESFRLVLAYMRTGFFICNDVSLLSGVIIEAEYFLVEGILETIKLRCMRNLHPEENFADDNMSLAMHLFDKKFHSIRELLNSPLFPSIYECEQSVRQFYRIVSTHDAATRLIVEITGHPHPVFEVCTVHFTSVYIIMTVVLVSFVTRRVIDQPIM